MGLPPAEHLFYIPAILLVGFALGYVFGGNAARAAERARKQRARE
jgi:hypothetical protein